MDDGKQLTLGSLFDGSGGFTLGGIMTGIRPLWSSEIEPFPVRVTEKRMPDVLQLGDIKNIHGGDIPAVDIITFGSPCQDMSIAGKRAGLEGTRSGLFYQAIRIIKEMREATDGQYPRYAVLENVKGMFSSNNGEDFRIVLEEFCKVKDENASVPRCEKWKNAGCILGGSFSAAWRLLNAQHWGVPQRRERIYLVADFDGQCAGNILFESEGLPGNFEPCKGKGKGTAGDPPDRTGEAGGICLTHSAGFCTEHSANARGIGYQEETSPTLRTGTVPAAVMFENHPQDARYTGPLDVAQTLMARYGTGGNNQPLVAQPPVAFGISSKESRGMLSDNPRSGFYEAETSRCLDANGGNPSCNQGGIAVVAIEGNGSRPSHNGDGYKEGETMYTLNATEQHAVAFAEKSATLSANDGPKGPSSQQLGNPAENFAGQPVYHSSKSSFHMKFSDGDAVDTLVASDYKDPPTVTKEPYYIVRRLAPVECARLQGFPDWWCDGLASEEPSDEEVAKWMEIFETHRKAVGGSSKPKTESQVRKWLKDPYSDSAAYKMWGNGVALPCVCHVLAGIVYYASLPDFLL